MEKIITGSCHCGSIQFELKENPKLVVNCHCDDCRKRNGSAFSTYMATSENDFSITKGQQSLRQYEDENVGIKYFCADCGSPVYNKNFRFPGLNMVFYGAFSQPEDFKPAINVFCESKHNWVDTLSNLKSFQGGSEK